MIETYDMMLGKVEIVMTVSSLQPLIHQTVTIRNQDVNIKNHGIDIMIWQCVSFFKTIFFFTSYSLKNEKISR